MSMNVNNVLTGLDPQQIADRIQQQSQQVRSSVSNSAASTDSAEMSGQAMQTAVAASTYAPIVAHDPMDIGAKDKKHANGRKTKKNREAQETQTVSYANSSGDTVQISSKALQAYKELAEDARKDDEQSDGHI